MKNKVREFVASTSITINASPAEIWAALTDPDKIYQYMFGTQVVSDWEEGSPIVWHGEWHGKEYEDKGQILTIEPERVLQYSHFSPLSGQPDKPENYHVVTIELSGEGPETTVWLTQDNNASEQERDESERNWRMMLESLKALLES